MKNVLKSFLPLDNENHEWPQIVSICIVCLNTVSMGLLFSWTSPSIPRLISNSSHIEPISIDEASYLAVFPMIAMIISGPIFAFTVDRFGRRINLVFIAFPQLISFILIALAENTITLYVSRFIAGIADAVIFNVIPIYVGEIATPKVRGLWGNLITISMFIGELTVNIIGSYCDIRTTAWILVCVPIIQILLMHFLLESPYYLIMKNAQEEARNVVKMLYWKSNVESELASLTNDVHRQISESGTYKDLFIISTNRKALLIFAAIRFIQQFMGMSAFLLYTQFILNQSGNHISTTTSAGLFYGILVVGTTIAAGLMKKFEKKSMLMFSAFGSGVMLVIQGIYFFIYEKTKLSIEGYEWTSLIGILGYITLASSGLATLPTLLSGELFSASVKGKALFVSNIFFSLCMLASGKIFQVMATDIGMYSPMILFAACSFSGVAVFYFFVPETKGKTLEEIQQNLKGGKKILG